MRVVGDKMALLFWSRRQKMLRVALKNWTKEEAFLTSLPGGVEVAVKEATVLATKIVSTYSAVFL